MTALLIYLFLVVAFFILFLALLILGDFFWVSKDSTLMFVRDILD